MARGAYYGGYFGRIAGVINPCSSYWGENGVFDGVKELEDERRAEIEAKQKPDSVYKQYLHRVLVVFREAMYKAKSDAEYWALNERVHYYWSKWNGQY